MNILKMTICDSDKTIFSSIVRKLKMIPKIDILEVEHMSRKNIKSGSVDIPIEYFYTEIANENTNKWTAIKFLIEKLDIKKEEVMAKNGIFANIKLKSINKKIEKIKNKK